VRTNESVQKNNAKKTDKCKGTPKNARMNEPAHRQTKAHEDKRMNMKELLSIPYAYSELNLDRKKSR
jgi:hypothetical protein